MTAKEYNDCIRICADDVMQFAVRLCPDKAECEDAVQEALAAMWTNRGKVGKEKGKSYLLSVTYRRLMSYFRRQSADRSYIADAVATGNTTTAPAIYFDTTDAIEAALKSLPETQRAILQLRDVEGYSYHEIGETLELSDEKVQVYLFRARVAMRKQLKSMGYDEYRQ